jgi:hypothetical protein
MKVAIVIIRIEDTSAISAGVIITVHAIVFIFEIYLIFASTKGAIMFIAVTDISAIEFDANGVSVTAIATS